MSEIKRLTPPSILLVEDNPLHVRLVTAMLAEVWPGYEDLYQARRLDRALEHLRDDKPDCVLLDLVLPDADGLEAVNVILAASPEVPIVVLSSHDDQEMALRAVSEGAQDYLVKGTVDAWELARSIKFAIHRHKSRIDGGSAEVVAFPTARVAHPDPDTSTDSAGIAIVDAVGVLRHGTSQVASLFGRPLYELIGTSVEDLIDPDDIGGWRIAVSRARQEPGNTHKVDLRIHGGHGNEVPTATTLRSLCGADGEVDALLLTCYVVHEPVGELPGGYAAMSDWTG